MIPLGILGSAVVPVSSSVEASFVSQDANPSNQSSYTFSGMALGEPAADRRIHVGVSMRKAPPPALITSVTIGGVTAKQHAVNNEDGSTTALWAAPVPAGTTGDVVVTADATLLRCHVFLYRSVGNAFPVGEDAPLGGQSIDFAVPSVTGGFALAVAQHINTGATGTWSGATRDGSSSAEIKTEVASTPTAGTLAEFGVDWDLSTYAWPSVAVAYGSWDGKLDYYDDSIWGVSGASLGAASSSIENWGPNFTQATSTAQPTVAEGTFKYASFDGGDLLLPNAGYNLNFNQTMIAVVRFPTTAARTVIGMSTGTGIRLGVSSTMKVQAAAHGGDFATSNTGDSAPTNAWCIISGRYVISTSLESRLNDGAIASVATTTVSTPDRRNHLGGNTTTPSPAMDIAEAWNFRRAFSNSEWDMAIAFLKNKYGIA